MRFRDDEGPDGGGETDGLEEFVLAEEWREALAALREAAEGGADATLL